MIVAPSTVADACQLRQGHATAVTGGNHHMAKRDRVGAGLRGETRGDVKAPFAFKHGTDRTPTQGQINNVLHLTDIDPVACYLQAVDAEAQLRLVSLLFDRRLSGPPDLLDQSKTVVGQGPQGLQVRATDDDGQVSGRSRRDFGRGINDRLGEIQRCARNGGLQPLGQLGDEIRLPLAGLPGAIRVEIDQEFIPVGSKGIGPECSARFAT